MSAIEVQKLFYDYSNGLRALDGVDLVVNEGDFFALLGPNGAGKTTLIGILTHLLLKQKGNIFIFGKDFDKNLFEIKKMMGVVPQEFNFNNFEKVEDILFKQAGFYGLKKSQVKEWILFLLKGLDLEKKRKDRAGFLSGGMKRRLMIARALVHRPKLLILDEPTAGVDIELRQSMYLFLEQLNQEGTTIILTTHYLEEAERLSNRIAFIQKGKIHKVITKEELGTVLEKEVFILNLKAPFELGQSPFALKQMGPNILEAEVLKEESLNPIFDWLNGFKVEVKSIQTKQTRLETLFLEVMNEK
jgi:ABC-2 type transport system ATP-binding protein